MITCPICDYHYSEKRTHCPTCGTDSRLSREFGSAYPMHDINHVQIVSAKGAERARQLPQSPRFFSTVDERG